MVEKLTWLAKKRVLQYLVHGYIIEAQPGRLQEVFERVKAVDCFRRFLRAGFLRTEGEFRPLARPARIIPRFNYIAALLPREEIYDLAEDPNIVKIYSDELVWALQFPVVPSEGAYEIMKAKKLIRFTTTMWTRKILGAETANTKGYTGHGVLVSVIDTGVSRIHEQTRRADFETVLPAQRFDENGHGQWCVSTVGGIHGVDEWMSRTTGKKIECMGMAPNCSLLAIKALGYVVGCGLTSAIIEGMELSLKRGADIVSMSLGGECTVDRPEDDPFYKPLKELVSAGVIPVIAAGNSGPDPKTINSPGCLEEALTVGAYDPITGEIASFSSRGPTPWGSIKPDIIMPGVNIHSGICGVLDFAGDGVPNRYSPISGTSMATPHAAGLIALMRQAHRDVLGRILTVDEIKRMMNELGKTKDNDSGWGPLTWDIYEQWIGTQYGAKL